MSITYATYRHGRPIMIDFQDTVAHSGGDIVVSGNQNLILHTDLLANIQGGASIGFGVYDIPKSTAAGSGAALANGSPVCWNATTHVVDPDLANGVELGIVIGSADGNENVAVTDADTLVKVLHIPNDGVFTEPVSTVAAAGNAVGNAAAIAQVGLVWVTAADGTKGVILPALPAGRSIQVKNDDAANNVLKVYPATGVGINALAANTAFSMPPRAMMAFRGYSATQAFTFPGTPLTDSTGGTAGSTMAATAPTQTFLLPIPALSALANAQELAIDPGFAGKITAINFRVGASPATTAAKAATVTAEVAGTNVTGGVVALTSANCTPAGAQVAGSAVTALNTFTSAQRIGVNVSGVTAFAEGGGVVEITVVNTDLANALASLNAF